MDKMSSAIQGVPTPMELSLARIGSEEEPILLGLLDAAAEAVRKGGYVMVIPKPSSVRDNLHCVFQAIMRSRGWAIHGSYAPHDNQDVYVITVLGDSER